MAFTTSDDFNAIQNSDSGTVGAGRGNDTYLITQELLSASKKITISDALFDSAGTNLIQLAGGLKIKSSQAGKTTLLLTLDNGAEITVLGADKFKFELGGNDTTGTTGTFVDFVKLKSETLKIGADGKGGVANIPGGSTSSGTFSIEAATAQVDEGKDATWTIKLDAADATKDYTVNLATLLEDGATAKDVGEMSVSGTGINYEAKTGVVTFAAGTTEATVKVPFLQDDVADGGETVTLKLTGTTGGAVLDKDHLLATVKITDKTSTESYKLTVDKTEVNETADNNTVTVTLTTKGVAAGTELGYTIAGGVSAEDFVDLEALTGTFTVGADGMATVDLTLAEDKLTEDDETFTVKLDNGKATSVSVTVQDTSTPSDKIVINVGPDDDGGTSPVADADYKVIFADEDYPDEYLYTLDGFAPGDQIDLPDAFFRSFQVENTSFTDGEMVLVGTTAGGERLRIELIGVDTQYEVFGRTPDSFNREFGEGSLI